MSRTTGRDCVERKPGGSSELHGLSANELACLAKTGDTAAFAALADQFRPGLLVVLTKRMNGRYADAEDVIQDTLTRAWQMLDSYDSSRSFSAWIYTIALRRATDHMRQQASRQRTAEEAQTRASAQSTVKATSNEEQANNIWAVAKKILSTTQYEAMWLYYAEELSIAEVAATMGKTVVGTRVVLHRARAKVRTRLGRKSHDDNE